MGDSFKYSQSYEKSAITDMRAFHNTSFFLAAGSGDDNVHYLVRPSQNFVTRNAKVTQNSATLLDRLTVAQVRNFYFRMYVLSLSMMTRRSLG